MSAAFLARTPRKLGVVLGAAWRLQLSQTTMAATAAAVVAQRRRQEAAEAAANLAEGGTPRPLPLSPKKGVKKIKKVEAKPVLPYQLEVFNFYQNQKVQIFVAVRGPHAAASLHNCPSAVRQGSAPLSQAPPQKPCSLLPGPDH